MRRRAILIGAGALAAAVPTAVAAPAIDKRLANRLTLWNEYASRTQTLLVRVSTTRETSLLVEPLVVTGSLLFIAPATLVLRDDSANGSTTIIDPSGSRLLSNREGLAPGPVTPHGVRPAADWMATRLVRLFAPGDPEALVQDCRAVVPKGRGYRLDLLPPRGSAIRRVIRSLSISLDPAAGAVTRIAIAEAQGDRVTLGLSDHRQNVAAQDVTSITDPLAALGIELVMP